MVIGIGIDMTEIERIQHALNRYGRNFIHRILTPHEAEKFQTSFRAVAFLAKRFAAKEAFVKALGTGFRQGISFQDIEVSNDKLGHPSLIISGQSQKILEKKLMPLSVAKIFLTLSDTRTHALAQVLIEGQNPS